jgi:hypothetical protein
MSMPITRRIACSLSSVAAVGRTARLVLLRPFANAKNLSITLVIHPDRYQQRHVADLARPAALEHEAVEVNIGVLAFDRSLRHVSIVP